MAPAGPQLATLSRDVARASCRKCQTNLTNSKHARNVCALEATACRQLLAATAGPQLAAVSGWRAASCGKCYSNPTNSRHASNVCALEATGSKELLAAAAGPQLAAVSATWRAPTVGNGWDNSPASAQIRGVAQILALGNSKDGGI